MTFGGLLVVGVVVGDDEPVMGRVNSTVWSTPAPVSADSSSAACSVVNEASSIAPAT